jgi:hypothetical protein
MNRFGAVIIIAMLSVGLALPAAADEIADQIKQGLKFYQGGKISQALGELEFAVAQLKQKKAESLAKLFPPAPSGWQAQKSQNKSMGAGFLGGGISASRSYKDQKRGRVKIEIMTDSPFIQSLAMVLSNPMFAQAGGKNKLIRFKGQKAMIKSLGEKRAELQTIIDNKVLLKVSASRVDEPDQVVRQFADKIDFDKIRELTR